ncbi:MAG TPA: hypothetical protein VEH30_16315 [Terriglobales bacterium]|nr:hypothetical protein [Terriglobales bacterium]
MGSLPQRAPRVHLEAATPAVLRFQDGQRTSGTLHVVSLTGGLLSLSNPVVQGSQVRLMFLTNTGSVLGGAEMLPPLTRDLQPFRFVSLDGGDRRRLGATIQASLQRSNEQQWIEKLRAASGQRERSRRPLLKALFGTVALAALAWVSANYLLHFHLLK